MFCDNCGKEISADDDFCGFCGASVTKAEQPGQAPAQATIYTPTAQEAAPPPPATPPPPAYPPATPLAPHEGGAKKGGLFSTAAGKALIVIIALVVAGGAALGVFLVINSGSEKKAREKAEEVTAQAADDLDEAGKKTEDLEEEYLAIDFKAVDQAKLQADENMVELGRVTKSAESTLEDLEDLDTGKLTPEMKDRIDALASAAEEYEKASRELNDLYARSLVMGEFMWCIDMAVAQFDSVLEWGSQAVELHNSDQFVDALNSANAALGFVDQSRSYLDRAAGLEPEADLSFQYTNLDETLRSMNTFKQVCETIIAGDYDAHNALSDQFNAEKDSIYKDISFDYNTFYAGEKEDALASIDEHLKKAAKYLKEAE